LLQDATAGDPIRGTKWVRKSLRRLVKELRRRRYTIGRETVRRLLQTLGYSFRATRPTTNDRRLTAIARCVTWPASGGNF
jgi:hypothetical protein